MHNKFVKLFSVILCVILFEHNVVQGKRFSSGGSRPSYSRPSYSRPSPSPSYSRPSPSPSYSRPSPSPSYSRPSPSPSPAPSPSYFHPSPSYSHPSPSYSHPAPSPSFSHPAPPSPGFNIGGSSGPIGPPKTSHNLGNAPPHNTGSNSNRAKAFTPPPYGFKSDFTENRPVGSYSPSSGNQRPLGIDTHNRPASPPYNAGSGVITPQRVGTQNAAPPHQGSNSNTAKALTPPPYGFRSDLTQNRPGGPPPYSPSSGNQRPLGFDTHNRPAPPPYNAGSGVITPQRVGTQNAAPPHQGSHPNAPKAATPPPYGFKSDVTQNKPAGPPPYSPSSGNQRPLGFDTHNRPAPPPYSVGSGAITSQRAGTQNAAPPYSGNTAYQKQSPYNPQYQSHAAAPAYNTGHAYQPGYTNPAGYGSPPAYNSAGYGHPPAYGQQPAGYYGHNYNQGGYNYHPPASGGVTIINNNNNHHYGGGGGYGYGYGGYGGWHSYPSYSYTSHDVGSGALGFFLGYSLAKVTSPSYHYHSSVGSYGTTPQYNHYEVHHYYHNSNSVPKEAEIQPNAVVGCVGDSGSFCPQGTYALCTNNGAVMCVASATTTVPCTDVKQTNCVKTTIPCLNSTAPECKGSSQSTTSVALPCISTAKVYANVTFVNNTLIVANTNTTALNTTLQNNATVDKNNVTTLANVTTLTNATTLANDTTAIPSTTTTTTPVPSTTISNEKKDPQVFCVTILALPAERKPSEAEKAFNGAKSIFGEFAVKAFGLA